MKAPLSLDALITPPQPCCLCYPICCDPACAPTGQVHWTDLRLVRGLPRRADAVVGPRGSCVFCCRCEGCSWPVFRGRPIVTAAADLPIAMPRRCVRLGCGCVLHTPRARAVLRALPLPSCLGSVFFFVQRVVSICSKSGVFGTQD